MNTTSRRYPLFFALGCEAIWWALWIGFMFWFMLGSTGVTGINYVREAFWKLSAHLFLAIALLTARKESYEEETQGHVSVSAAPWLFFAIFIDLYTIFDAFIVIFSHPVAEMHVHALQSIAVLAMVFNVFGLIAYLVLVWTNPPPKGGGGDGLLAAAAEQQLIGRAAYRAGHSRRK
jgi:hypothetical protein